MLNKLISMYEAALEEAQSLWLSEYCCSKEEREQRIHDDEESLKEFIEICERVRGEV